MPRRRTPTNLLRLTQLAEPPRQELLRRINRTPGGTGSIVAMRRALLARVARQPELQAVEADFLHLLSSWFNPGFLQLQRVDWNSPAQLLEQIIHHEAVHEIDGWDDLRRRLQPDRRCFAFFHPQLPDEPLIFVEVALLPEMPDAIAPLIDKASTPLPPSQFKVAAFYSISNCQPGLKGVSLGNFLIKRVAEELKRELPQLQDLLHAVADPRLRALAARRRAVRGPDQGARASAWPRRWPALRAGLRRRPRPAGARAARCARCRADGHAGAAAPGRATTSAAHVAAAGGDPVARFHLDNGARLERLNALGRPVGQGR